MFEQIIQIDKSCLLAINGVHAPWADAFFWQVSQTASWIPLYLLLIICMFVKFRGQRMDKAIRLLGSDIHIPVAFVAFAMIAIAVGGADLLCAQFIKPLVARLRPVHDAEIGALVHTVNGYRGGMYGFCSNHAANTMACASLCVAIFTREKPWQAHLYVTLPLAVWVLLNCYSRMYLGVHYPLDVLAGMVVGLVIAWLVWMSGKRCLFQHEVRAHRDAGV